MKNVFKNTEHVCLEHNKYEKLCLIWRGIAVKSWTFENVYSATYCVTWTSYLMTLNLNFLICEIRLIPLFSWESDEDQQDKHVKHSAGWEHSKCPTYRAIFIIKVGSIKPNDSLHIQKLTCPELHFA